MASDDEQHVDHLQDVLYIIRTLERDSQDDEVDQRLKEEAVLGLLALSGSSEGHELITSHLDVLAVLSRARQGVGNVAKAAWDILVNLSAGTTKGGCDCENVLKLMDLNRIVKELKDRREFSDKASAVLSNLSRNERGCAHVLDALMSSTGLGDNTPSGNEVQQGKGANLKWVVDLLCLANSPHSPSLASPVSTRPPLPLLGALLGNLTQNPAAQQALLDGNGLLLLRLLPFLSYQSCSSLRLGIISAIRNLCLEHSRHSLLLSNELDLLPRLLLPLAGPDEFTEEENEGLPLDLQFLPPEKQREADPSGRRDLLEALTLLCATATGRRTVRDANTYLILRQLHSWEADEQAKQVCEALIQILIGDEPSPDMDNLLTVPIPPDIQSQLAANQEQ
uniref:protein HGH1 homolog n=1 Tax=Myxine glutinosa TaxID=7769 RepID=UPI00358F4FB1